MLETRQSGTGSGWQGARGLVATGDFFSFLLRFIFKEIRNSKQADDLYAFFSPFQLSMNYETVSTFSLDDYRSLQIKFKNKRKEKLKKYINNNKSVQETGGRKKRKENKSNWKLFTAGANLYAHTYTNNFRFDQLTLAPAKLRIILYVQKRPARLMSTLSH